MKWIKKGKGSNHGITSCPFFDPICPQLIICNPFGCVSYGCITLGCQMLGCRILPYSDPYSHF